MSDPDREHLLGYLLGALDSDEQAQVEQALQIRPELREPLEKLRLRVAVLGCDREYHSPPDGLARRTCEWLELQIAGSAEQPPTVAASARHGFSPALRERLLAPRWRTWSLADVVVSAGIALVAAMLFFPAIAHSRFRSQVLTCQNNLRQIGDALFLYAQDHQGKFPQEELDGPRAYAGIYGSLLYEGEYLKHSGLVLCPAAWPRNDVRNLRIPYVTEIEQATGNRRRELQRQAGGDYGYSLGYWLSKTFVGPRDNRRATFAILADVPSWNGQSLRSVNHCGLGQNVLYEGGNIRYTTVCATDDINDHLFLNDRGEVGAGLHSDDSVLGAGWTSP